MGETRVAEKWRTVRVFISSTFRDMHAERDHLVKVVFPELRERMAGRNLYLVDVDLRWGVTEEEAEQGKVLEVCFDEIETCRPFFIGILGERYGYVPATLPEDTEFAHPWLGEYIGHSLTALEIIHGVLRSPELAQRAFFYFRDSRFTSQVPEIERADYVAESTDAAQKLAALKDKIRASGRPVMEDYPCRWDDEQGHVVELEVLGQRVLEDLWTAICAVYPEEAPETDSLTVERQMHEAFVEERSRLHIGRKEQARRLTEYVQGKDRRPTVITGESGCGKSAFLASWYRKYVNEHPDDVVLAYFIGASPDSANYFRLLRNMCLELKRRFGLRGVIPEDDMQLSETLAVALVSASRNKGRIIIVLDALDQLLPLEAAHGLGWLLDYMPDRTRLVVSTLEGDCLDVLRRRESEEIVLPSLAEDEQRQIVRTLLSEWRRKLDERQTAALLAHPGAKNPLYLRVALEELRLFGKFERLTERIKTLAEDIPRLFDQVLERLERDHGQELVSEAFSMLGCSRYGVSETELLELLRKEGEEQVPRILLARLTRSARMYMAWRGDLIGFFHHQLAEASAARYPDHKKTHAKLAAYFANAPLERKLDEYPYQLQDAENWDTLAKTLSDLEFLEYAFNKDRKYEWMGYWRSLEGRFEPARCYESAVSIERKAQGQTQSLAQCLCIVGWFLDDMGLYPSALAFKERTLRIDEKTLGPDHPDVATDLNNLASTYDTQGKYEQALPLYQRALKIHEKALHADHPLVATDLNNLAKLYHAQGKYEQALPLCQRALNIREKAEGRDHPDVATGLNNLARLYGAQGRYEQALPLCQRALDIHERALGPDHPHVARTLNSLAGLRCAQGKYEQALPLYQRALKIHERALGPDHPDVATELHDLALLYRAQGKYEQALPLCQRALKIHERALGPDHPHVATDLHNLASLYRARGEYEQALPLYQRALKIDEKALGTDHPDVATSLNSLGLLYSARGEYEQALPLYQRALKIDEKALGPDHPDVATGLNNLARLYGAQGRYEQALPLCQRALKIDEKALGTDHPDVAIDLRSLGLLYYDQGKYEQTLPLCQRALRIDEKALGPDHPHVATDLNNLAELYNAEGKYEQALPLYQRALRISEKALGGDHHNTKTINNNLKACEEAMRKR
jgi:tetratricopeptide (TPR) repeat protein